MKTGRAPQPDTTAAMAHGTVTEPLAREAYEKLTGNVMQRLLLVDGDYSASLDGISFGGDLVLDIKSPKSKDSKILTEDKAGRISIDIYWQPGSTWSRCSGRLRARKFESAWLNRVGAEHSAT